MKDSKYYTRWLMPEEYPMWDQLVCSSSQGTLFHQTTWLKGFKNPFRILGCFNKADELVGGVPVQCTHILSVPLLRPSYFVPYSGPVIRESEGKRFTKLSTYKKIVEPLARTLTDSFWFARLKMHYVIDDIQPFLWTNFVPDIRYTYIVDLEDLDTAFMEFDVDRRNDIRKGQRDGLYCEESEDIEEFIPLLLNSLQAQGIKWSTQRVTEFRDCFSTSCSMGRGKLFLVRNSNGHILGGAWLVWDQHRAYYLLAGMDRDLGSRTSMPTLIWNIMQFTKQTLGLGWLDLDGADVPQIEGFTRAFGGHLVPCYVATWVSPYIRLFWSLRRMY